MIGQGYASESKHFGEEILEFVVTEEGEVSVVARVDIPEMSYIDTGRLVHFMRGVEEIMARTSEKHDSIEEAFAPIRNFISDRSNNSSIMVSVVYCFEFCVLFCFFVVYYIIVWFYEQIC